MKNIVLTGMPGAGKSTIGVVLSKTLGKGFVDTDIIIQNSENRLLQEIIDTNGIDRFLEIEENAVLNLQVDNCVIATGGSVIYSQIAMNKLKSNGIIIFFHLPYGEIEGRLKNIVTRGVVIRKGTTLKDIYEERVPLYLKYADIIIDCSNKSIEQSIIEITEQISAKL